MVDMFLHHTDVVIRHAHYCLEYTRVLFRSGLRSPQQAEALKGPIGYMTQRFALFEDLKVRENLEFLAAVQGLRKPAAAARVDELLHAYHQIGRASGRERVGQDV